MSTMGRRRGLLKKELKLNLLIASDHRYLGYQGGVYDTYAFDQEFFSDYKQTFDTVEVICRMSKVGALPPKAFRADGEGVRFIETPDIRGVSWVLGSSMVCGPIVRRAVERADAIISRMPSRLGWHCAREAMKKGKPLMLEIVGDPWMAIRGIGKGPQYQALAWLERERLRSLAGQADIVCYVSKEHLQRFYPAGAEAISAGVSDIRLKSEEVTRARKFDSPPEEFHIAQVAGLLPYKRQSDLIQATAGAISKGIHIKLHFIGDGEMRSVLERMCRELNIDNHVVFHGHIASREEINGILDRSHLFVLSSASEGMPRVILEAMSRGLPVCGSDTGGVAELVRESELFPVGDVDKLDELIVTLANSPEALAEMSEYSVKVANEYVNDQLSPKRVELYRALSSTPKGPGKTNPFLKELGYQLRWGAPIWLLYILTNWWPNNRLTIKLRGALHRPFFKKCGKNLQMASDVRLLNTHEIEIGDDVYLAYNVWLNGLGKLYIEDEVILSPFVTVSTLSHCYKDGSFRFGAAQSGPVRIGKGSWLAAHVSVSYGVNIGEGCLIGANSAVVKDVPAGHVAGGVPAEVVGECTEKEPTIISRSGWKTHA